jgi:hypothetical protein
MRKLRDQLILVCLLSGLLLGAQKANASQSVALFFNGSQLQNSEVLDDLDPRDSNNQEIKNKKAIDGLTDIFRSGLFNLLAASELYTAAEILSTFAKAVNLASTNLVRNLPQAVKNLIGVSFTSSKRLSEIFSSLALIFGFCLTAIRAVTAFKPMSYQFSNPSPVVLRC